MQTIKYSVTAPNYEFELLEHNLQDTLKATYDVSRDFDLGPSGLYLANAKKLIANLPEKYGKMAKNESALAS